MSWIVGDSAGFPRHVSSPDIFTENFSAAVDFLGLQAFVDRERIGVIGICGSGGFTTTSDLAMMNFKLLDHIDEISPRSILFVVGDRAHSNTPSGQKLKFQHRLFCHLPRCRQSTMPPHRLLPPPCRMTKYSALALQFLAGWSTKFFSENAYAAASEPKEIYEVEDAEHIDLYDRRDRIPFEKIAGFFMKNM